ncbi:MAG: FAD-binding oxidoreductase [Phreatobacter sp.]|uniref:FAD-binding oxidoreductase n=1 Tax=Phreatobacter sp. TaxID=1966341 RepID=UPI00403517E4
MTTGEMQTGTSTGETRPRYDIDGLKAKLAGIKTEDNANLVRQKSRDFYWYSPTLKRQLDHVVGDIIVAPVSEQEVVRVLASAHELGIPVTPRGTGTGNYGQAMPLSGGIVLDLSGMNKVLTVQPGRFVAEAGAVIADIDKVARPQAQEIRMHPSTYATASVGGFIAGGSGGVGSITWGGLRDAGNVIRLKVVTMEAKPRVLELTGDDLAKVAHAYGTNGIITEVEMPLGPAYPWTDLFLGFDTFERAAAFANLLGEADGIAKKNVAVIAAPAPQTYFLRHQDYMRPGQHVVVAVVADFAVDAALNLAAKEGAELLLRSDKLADEERRKLPPGFELTWNHTTLRALRVDPAITYLQVLYPFPDQVKLSAKLEERFGDELISHLEFVRFDGKVTCFGLPMVRFTTEERLEEIMKIHEDMGAPIFNPHRYTLEEGGMKQTDAVQLAFKKEADPQGLLNPGKMIAWEDPSYDYAAGGTFLFKGLSAEAGKA